MKNFIFLHTFVGDFFDAIAVDLYFPPLTGNTWETITASSLDLDETKIEQLYDFLEEVKSKVVLKDVRILVEKYFGSFTNDNIWYWAFAEKLLQQCLLE